MIIFDECRTKILGNDFNRNVLTLITGSTIAQAIPVAISPILTRIYSPKDFGILAIFFALTNIFGGIANARYELAIMLPHKDEDAINIVALGFLISSSLSFLLLLVVLFFNSSISSIIGSEGISFWLYFVPLSVFLLGGFNLLNYFNTRKKYYKDISKANIIKAISLAVVQLGIGLLKAGATGLITGTIFSFFTGNLKLFRNIIKDKELLNSLSRKSIMQLAKRYIKFPKFTLWATLLNTMSRDLTNILISSFYSVATLGYYSFVQRILGMPSLLVGTSIGQVFFEEATKEKNETGAAIETFKSTFKKLLFIAIPSFTVLFFIVEDMFAIVFGEEWRVAGEYAQILIPLFAVRFVGGTLSIVLIIFENQKIVLFFEIFNFIMFTLPIVLVYYLNKDFEFYLYLIGSILFILYVIYTSYYYIVSKNY
jgi:O-antigen/teichoic acid export membrane protein